jgi:Sensors of blue-light using FAD
MSVTPVFELIYVSRANEALLTRNARQNLRIHAQIQNARRDITGLLLYSNGVIMQVLQGDEALVRERFARIATDNRHRDVTLLRADTIDTRTFAKWSMALIDIESSSGVSEGKMQTVLAEVQRKDHPVPEGLALIQLFVGAEWRQQLVA